MRSCSFSCSKGVETDEKFLLELKVYDWDFSGHTGDTENFVSLNSPGATALSCRGATYFAASAADSILSLVSWVIRLLFVYREQEHVTGASHMPGSPLKERALDIFYRIGPLVCRTVHKRRHSFFAKQCGEKSWLLEQIFERARTVLTNYRYEPFISLSSLAV